MRHTDARHRESVTAAETDRASNTKVIVEQGHIIVEKGRATTRLLEEVRNDQKESNVHLELQTKGLDTLQAKADQATGSLGQSQIMLGEQRTTIEGIHLDIGDIKQKMSDGNAEMSSLSLEESSELGTPTLTLGALSKILSFILSGTMVISAHVLATQARELSQISKKLVLDGTEWANIPPASSKQPHEQEEIHPTTAQEDYRIPVVEFHNDTKEKMQQARVQQSSINNPRDLENVCQ